MISALPLLTAVGGFAAAKVADIGLGWMNDRRHYRRDDIVWDRDRRSKQLELFTEYHALGTYASVMGTDLPRLLWRIRTDAPEEDVVDQTQHSLWNYAKYMQRLQRFVDDGRTWILSSAAVEGNLSETAWHLAIVPQLQYRHKARLVQAVNESDGGMIGTMAQLQSDDLGCDTFATWVDWIRSCTCQADAPARDCTVHEAIRLGDRFWDIVEEEWYKFAPWYRPSERSAPAIRPPSMLPPNPVMPDA